MCHAHTLLPVTCKLLVDHCKRLQIFYLCLVKPLYNESVTKTEKNEMYRNCKGASASNECYQFVCFFNCCTLVSNVFLIVSVPKKCYLKKKICYWDKQVCHDALY